MGAVPAELQRVFGLNYVQVKEVIDEMLEEGCLVYQSGVKYAYVRTFEERFRDYLESVSKQEIAELWGADPEGNWKLEVKLRCMALRLIISEQSASPTLLQRKLPIGYSQACGFIEWMEKLEFISVQTPRGRLVYITSAQLDEIIDGAPLDNDGETDGEQTSDEESEEDGVENEGDGGGDTPFTDGGGILEFSDKVDLRGMPMSDDEWDDYDNPDYLDHSDEGEKEEVDEEERKKRIDDMFDSLFGHMEKYEDDEEDYDDEDYDDEDEEDDRYFDDEQLGDADDDDYFEKQNAAWDGAFDDYDKRFKSAITRMAIVLSNIAYEKSQPVSPRVPPEHTLWENEDEFADEVMKRFERIVKSDKNMSRSDAIKKAETYLEGVRDTHDGKMMQVYERLVYEMKNFGEYAYNRLKKQFFGDE